MQWMGVGAFCAAMTAFLPASHAQWTESCELRETDTQVSEGVTCRCPAGMAKVRDPNRELSPFGVANPSSGIRVYNCVMLERPPAQACVTGAISTAAGCDGQGEATVLVRNGCDNAYVLRVCIDLKNGRRDCGFSPFPVPPGSSWSYRACAAKEKFLAGVLR